MKILFIANLVPFPLDGGGKIKTFTALKALSTTNTVDLVCFYEKEDKVAAEFELGKFCRNVIMLPIRVTSSEYKVHIAEIALKCLVTGKSLSVYKYYDRDMEKTLIECAKKENYDLVYFNILQMYQYKLSIQRIAPNVVYVLDTQNCETAIFLRRARESKNAIKQKYLKVEAHKLGEFEQWAIQDADKLILLSDEDKRELEKLSGNELKCDIIPIGVREPEQIKVPRKISNNTLDVLFLGTLTWAPNNDGMIWFMQYVMPEVSKLECNYNFYIVGKGASDYLKTLAAQYENVTITGYVQSVDEYYEKCDFMIVPLFFGSGQRVKIIEGFSRGMPIISTPTGAEGLKYIDHENILIANDELDFLNCMNEMKNMSLRQELSKKARSTYEMNYSIDAVGKQLNVVIRRSMKEVELF